MATCINIDNTQWMLRPWAYLNTKVVVFVIPALGANSASGLEFLIKLCLVTNTKWWPKRSSVHCPSFSAVLQVTVVARWQKFLTSKKSTVRDMVLEGTEETTRSPWPYFPSRWIHYHYISPPPLNVLLPSTSLLTMSVIFSSNYTYWWGNTTTLPKYCFALTIK